MTKMAGIKVYLSDEAERKFREAAMNAFGYQKGSLSIAAEKALREWSKKVNKGLKLVESSRNPIDSIWGILSKVDKSGVELQHEARALRSKKNVSS